MDIIPFSKVKPTPDNTHRPSAAQKLVIHYSLNGHVLCEATHQLSVDVNFLPIPLPVIHEMKRGSK